MKKQQTENKKMSRLERRIQRVKNEMNLENAMIAKYLFLLDKAREIGDITLTYNLIDSMIEKRKIARKHEKRLNRLNARLREFN